MMESIAILFPGQGVQKVGMGRDFLERSEASKRIFEKAKGVLDIPILDLILNGPEEELLRTSITQPAIFTVSCAIYEAVKERYEINPLYGAGHSLGEYNALYAAGVFSFEDGLRIVAERGRVMEEASGGGMAAVIGLSREVVEDVCKSLSDKERVIVPANFNSKSQIVISGDKELIKKAIPLLKEKGARRVVELKVSGAFHSPYMEKAAEKFRNFLEGVTFHEAMFPVVSNVDAMPHTSPEEIKHLLYLQIKSPVEWVKTVEYLVNSGIRACLEVGPGSVLAGLIRGITKDLKVTTVTKYEDLEKLND